MASPLWSESSSVARYQQLAREIMPTGLFDVLFGMAPDMPGAETVTNNVHGFDSVSLRPRILSSVKRRNMAMSLLGQSSSAPILFAPVGQLQRMHPDGELAVARAASSADLIMVLSMCTGTSIEPVVEAADGRVWFQVYLMEDRRVTEAVVSRAERAGCRALVVTVDNQAVASYERESRHHLYYERYDTLAGSSPDNLAAFASVDESITPRLALSRFVEAMHASPSWDDLAWLRTITGLPIVVKGIQTAEDASLCVDSGVDGLVVSNHGGHGLDGARATVESLPEIVAVVAGAIPVLMDGGVRRGNDILKALTLGAKGILIGRAMAWALAVGGEAAVSELVTVLRSELDRSMVLCGINDTSSLAPGQFSSFVPRAGR